MKEEEHVFRVEGAGPRVGQAPLSKWDYDTLWILGLNPYSQYSQRIMGIR